MNEKTWLTLSPATLACWILIFGCFLVLIGCFGYWATAAEFSGPPGDDLSGFWPILQLTRFTSILGACGILFQLFWDASHHQRKHFALSKLFWFWIISITWLPLFFINSIIFSNSRFLDLEIVVTCLGWVMSAYVLWRKPGKFGVTLITIALSFWPIWLLIYVFQNSLSVITSEDTIQQPMRWGLGAWFLGASLVASGGISGLRIAFSTKSMS